MVGSTVMIVPNRCVPTPHAYLPVPLLDGITAPAIFLFSCRFLGSTMLKSILLLALVVISVADGNSLSSSVLQTLTRNRS